MKKKWPNLIPEEWEASDQFKFPNGGARGVACFLTNGTAAPLPGREARERGDAHTHRYIHTHSHYTPRERERAAGSRGRRRGCTQIRATRMWWQRWGAERRWGTPGGARMTKCVWGWPHIPWPWIGRGDYNQQEGKWRTVQENPLIRDCVHNWTGRSRRYHSEISKTFPSFFQSSFRKSGFIFPAPSAK